MLATSKTFDQFRLQRYPFSNTQKQTDCWSMLIKVYASSRSRHCTNVNTIVKRISHCQSCNLTCPQWRSKTKDGGSQGRVARPYGPLTERPDARVVVCTCLKMPGTRPGPVVASCSRPGLTSVLHGSCNLRGPIVLVMFLGLFELLFYHL